MKMSQIWVFVRGLLGARGSARPALAQTSFVYAFAVPRCGPSTAAAGRFNFVPAHTRIYSNHCHQGIVPRPF